MVVGFLTDSSITKMGSTIYTTITIRLKEAKCLVNELALSIGMHLGKMQMAHPLWEPENNHSLYGNWVPDLSSAVSCLGNILIVTTIKQKIIKSE